MVKVHSKLSQDFGRHIRSIREKKGISQEKLGFDTGLDRTYVSGIERGVRNPSLNNIAKIAKGLGVPLIDLFRM